jgi:P-type Cu+ transporter
LGATREVLADEEKSITFPVTGMTCAACQSRVQRALTGEPGVIDASVNLVTRSAAIRYDSTAVTPARLVEAVRATGYEAELPAVEESPSHAASRHEHAEVLETRELTIKAVVSVLVGIAAMGVSMFSFGSQAANYALLAMAAAILVWAGRDIYRRAWLATRHRSADMNTLVALGTGSAFIYSLIATVAPNLFARNGIAPNV